MGTKRYAFWRDSRGLPCKDGYDKCCPKYLLDECYRHARSAANGVSWPWGHGYENIDVIISMIAVAPGKSELFSENASQMAREGLMSAISDSLNKGQSLVKPRSVLECVDDVARHFFQARPKDYVYVTSLSASGWPTKEAISIGSCKVIAIDDRQGYPMEPQLERRLQATSLSPHIGNTPYQLLRIECAGQAAEDAALQAREELNLLRGLWTLLWTHRSRTKYMMSSGPRPLARFHVGAVSTIHDPAGPQVGRKHWYDPAFPPLYSTFPAQRQFDRWDEVEDKRSLFLSKLDGHPFGDQVKSLIRRYAVALDGHDDESCFLNLWSLLEAVTCTVDAKYDRTIDRATWGFEEKRVHDQFLQHCRMRRNRYVHGAISTGYAENVNQQLKEIVERHLLQLIRNDFKVSSLDKYGEFLSQPDRQESLEFLINRQQHALGVLAHDAGESCDGAGI